MIFLDLETRSYGDIKILGSQNYADDPSTEIIVGVALRGDDEYMWHHKEDPPEELQALIAAGETVVCHNMVFDKAVWEAKGYPPFVNMIDTLPLARQASLPGGLDKIGKFLFDEGKHKGQDLMKRLCKPHRSGKFLPLNKQNLRSLTAYCHKDNDLTRRVYDHLDHQEPEAVAVDAKINQRGFAFDVELATRLLECDAHNRKEMLDNCPVDGELLRSNPQLTAWLEEREVEVPNLQRATLEGLIEEGVDPVVQAVLEARIGATRITSSKVKRALGMVCRDGRIRNHKVYWGAQTGRSASRGINVANLPRGVQCDVDSLRTETLAGYMPNDMELSTLIRACIKGPLTVCDYAQIEVRVLAWLAGEEVVLETFRQGQDIYKFMASKVFGTPVDEVTKDQRTVGKTLILGCGYGLGADTFEVYGKGFGIDFDSIGYTPQELVDAYRDAHSMVSGADTGRTFKGHKIREKGMWKDCHKAMKAIVSFESNEEYANRAVFKRDCDDVLMILPSGRFVRYRQCMIEDRETSWGEIRPTITYQSTRGYRTALYPSKVSQNLTQAVARDLLYNGLINCDKRGIPIVLDVYDEIVAEGHWGDKLSEAMTDLPTWADGIPVEAEPDEFAFYRK